MTSVLRKYALVALCGTAIVAISQSAQAASWSIVGGATLPSGQFPGYGTAVNRDNVVNNPASQVTDPTGGTPQFWNSGGQINALYTTSGYNVAWLYMGSESGDVIKFQAPGVLPSTGYVETNANNNCPVATCGISLQVGPLLMGSVTGLTSLLTPFTFTDTTVPSSISNGSNVSAGTATANFISSYASLVGVNLVLQAAPSDWIVVGFNDTGGLDDNHDDFIFAAQIQEAGPAPGPTPIPGALPLLGSVLGGGFLVRRLRKRRQAQA